MAGLMDELMGALGGAGGLGALVGGGDDPKKQQAAKLGLEAILGGLAGNAQDPDKASAIFETLDRHDGSALDQARERFGSPEVTADGSKILGHVFGGKQDAVAQNLAGKAGIDVGDIAKMLPALAPIVMGALAKKKASGGLDPSSLAGMLKGESDGFDLGDLMGMLGGGGGAAGALAGAMSGGGGGGSMGGAKGVVGILGKLRGLLGRR